MQLSLQLKGQSRGLVVFITGVLFLAILVVWLNGSYLGATEKLISDIDCFTEVRQHAALGLLGLHFAQSIDSCGPEPYLIRKLSTANSEIALEMAKCWNNFGGPEKLDLFEDDYLYCHVCKIFQFDDKEEKLTGFSSYLIENEVPGKNLTYAEYFAPRATDEAIKVKKLRETLENMQKEQKEAFEAEFLNTSKDYASVFVYAKGQNSLEKLYEHLAAKTASGKVSAGGAVIGGGITIGGVAMVIFGTGLTVAGGWIAIVGGAVVATAAGVGTYFSSPASIPEHASLIILSEYTSEELLGFGCQRLE